MEKLSDCTPEELDQEVTRSSSLVQIAETIIDSARAENEFLNITNGTGSGFIPTGIDAKKQLPEA